MAFRNSGPQRTLESEQRRWLHPWATGRWMWEGMSGGERVRFCRESVSTLENNSERVLQLPGPRETELVTWRRFQKSSLPVLFTLLDQPLALGLEGTSGRRAGLLTCPSATSAVLLFKTFAFYVGIIFQK